MFSDAVNTNKKSFLFRLNPTLKFVAFVLIIAIIFLPLGFFIQTIVGIFLLVLFFCSRIRKKTLWNIFKSLIILFSLLFLINWALYKDPLAVNIQNHFDLFIGNSSIANYSPVSYYNQGVFVSEIWGGTLGYKNSNFLSADIVRELGVNLNQTKLENLWNGLNDAYKAFYLKSYNNDANLAMQAYWLVNNGFSVNGITYKVMLIDNADLNNIASQALIYSTNWYTLSPKAIQLALYVTLKVFLMILAATLLTATTNSIELTNALENILSPLKLFRLPVNEAAMIIAIALRFIPSLLSESKRIMNAQASRGIDFKNGNFLDKSKCIISLVVPLFSIAFKKAEELANAMDARSYNPRYARTKYRIFQIKIIDWIGYFLICLLFGFSIAITICPLLFSPFGIFEITILL